MSGPMPTNYSEHQIVLRRAKGSQTTVSCKCRAVFGSHDRQGGEYHEPMDWPEGMTAFEVYNEPNNHYRTFTRQDRIPT